MSGKVSQPNREQLHVWTKFPRKTAIRPGTGIFLDRVKYSSCKTSARFHGNYTREKTFPLTLKPPRKVPRKVGEVFRFPGTLKGRGYVLKEADWWNTSATSCTFIHLPCVATNLLVFFSASFTYVSFIYGPVTCERE